MSEALGYKMIDRAMLQILYMSKDLFDGCLELYNENGEKYAFVIHYDVVGDIMDDDPYKSMFVALDMLKETYNDDLIQEIHSMDPTKQVCVIVVIDSLSIFKHIFFAHDAALYLPPLPQYCSYCDRSFAKQRCSVCKDAWYCDEKCQKLDWKQHKKYCQL